jgi:hypothetical protein
VWATANAELTIGNFEQCQGPSANPTSNTFLSISNPEKNANKKQQIPTKITGNGSSECCSTSKPRLHPGTRNYESEQEQEGELGESKCIRRKNY